MRSAREVKDAVQTLLYVKPEVTEELLNLAGDAANNFIMGLRVKKEKNFSHEKLFYLTVWFCLGGGCNRYWEKDNWAFDILDKLIEEEEKKRG